MRCSVCPLTPGELPQNVGTRTMVISNNTVVSTRALPQFVWEQMQTSTGPLRGLLVSPSPHHISVLRLRSLCQRAPRVRQVTPHDERALLRDTVKTRVGEAVNVVVQRNAYW
jgi:hypothetical protein